MLNCIHSYYQLKQVCQLNQYWCLPVSMIVWSLGGGNKKNKRVGGSGCGAQPEPWNILGGM